MAEPLLRRAVTVVVPVYNAAAELRALVASLEIGFPSPMDGLSFVFADDGSVDAGLPAIWALPFFRRRDVTLHRSPDNRGFVETVNAAVGSAPADDDIVLLNSDTRIFGNAFARLQQDAYSAPRIASVTPLTNNGTIASLFGFPGGEELPPGLSPERVAEAVHALDLSPPPVWAPTGVGFCLYMTRAAIREIGLLDPRFGRGYGEEVDWCQKARTKGWRHLISTRTFVYHSGTRSFTETEKREAIERGTERVLSRYPDYLHQVRSYCARDPARFHRLRILLDVLAGQSRGEPVLYALHADPDGRTPGGTERHVRQLQHIVAGHGRATVEIFPQVDRLRLRGFQGGHLYFDQAVEIAAAEAVIALLAASVPIVHAHHFGGWSENDIDRLLGAPFRRKLFTLHDFAPLCPSGFMLSGPDASRFCEVEPDLAACNRCLVDNVRHLAESIERYRERWVARLAAFDRVLVPSRAMLSYYRKALAPAYAERAAAITVFENDLSHLVALSRHPVPCTAAAPRPLVAFVGAIGRHKGAELIAEAAGGLRAAGFEVEVVGELSLDSAASSADLRVTRYRSPAELMVWLRQRAPMIAAFPSLAAESFCYAFYESILLSDTAIPVVGPFGNPAEVVRETGSGVVMAEASASALVAACQRARAEYSTLAPLRERLRDALRASDRDYAREYVALLDPVSGAAGATAGEPPDLVALEARAFESRGAGPAGSGPPASELDAVRIAGAAELERLTPEAFTHSAIEHLHRYVLAAELCRGKTVLDIASGEGYGSAILAKSAARVVGVDLSPEVVAHARARYPRPNLSFLEGRADSIPLGDASVDVVVSFETLEHHDRHDEMLAEIKRVLRPAGLAILSTPDKLFYSDITRYRNVYHVKELYLDELVALVQRHFARHRLLFQGTATGTIIVPEGAAGSASFYRGDFLHQESTHALPRHDYVIAVASDGELPDLRVSVFDGRETVPAAGTTGPQSTGDETVPRLERRLEAQVRVIRDIEGSLSYRVGRALTWPLRRLLGR